MGAIAKASGASVKAAQANDFKSILKHAWPRMEAVMPKHMSPERMYQVALSAYNKTPRLSECTPQSVLGCLMQCTALGMEPSAVDGLGRAYIIPFNNRKTGRMEATFILGYKGMIDLARRSGQLTDISARAVHAGDSFEYRFGLDEELIHVPSPDYDGTQPITHVYCVAHFRDGGHYIEVMTKSEVDAVRKRSKSANSGPWVTDYEAMAKKTVVRRAFPFMPVSVEQQAQVLADERVPVVSEEEAGAFEFADEPAYDSEPEADEPPANVDPETGEVRDERD